MTIKSKLALSAGLAAMFLISPASGAAFSATYQDDGTVAVTFDTTGVVDTTTVGVPNCAATISLANAPTTVAHSFTQDMGATYNFTFESAKFSAAWNPDTCGVMGGSLTLVALSAEAETSTGNWELLPAIPTDSLPALNAMWSHVQRTTAGGYANAFLDMPTFLTVSGSTSNTVSELTLKPVLEYKSQLLPNLPYRASATLAVLSDG